MLLDNASPPRELNNFVIRNRKPMPIFDWNRHVLHRFYAGVINKFEFFAAENFLQDRPEACFQRWLENVNLVRIDRAGPVLHRFYAVVKKKFNFFAAENFLKDGREACFQRWLKNVNLARINR